ncbi:unnamed protein product, partial [Brenthis ino]
MVEPPWTAYAPTNTTVHGISSINLSSRATDTKPAHARSKLSQNTEERACRTGAPTRAPTSISTPRKKSPPPNNNKKLPPLTRTSIHLSL